MTEFILVFVTLVVGPVHDFHRLVESTQELCTRLRGYDLKGRVG